MTAFKPSSSCSSTDDTATSVARELRGQTIHYAVAAATFGIALAACSDDRKIAPPPTPATASDARPAGDAGETGALGDTSFEVASGNAAARAHFKRGLLALHSFWYDEAAREFQAAIDADPQMNMAYWGAAMSKVKLLWGDDDLAGARKILSKMPDPDHLSPREEAWVLATVPLVKEKELRASRANFAAAMGNLHARFPDDESATFYAAALLATIRPDDPNTTAVRKRAAELALGVYQRNPKHPGAAHYIIHAYDTPELAAQALPQARDYAKIAPEAFHARHMPAHIFVRLGMWEEAITSCEAAWDASLASARRNKLSANYHDFHSLNWLVEMPFELGKRTRADAAMTSFGQAVRAGLGHAHRTLYASQVASYLARTGEWKRVDELLEPLAAPAVDEAAPETPGRAGEAATHCAPAPAASPVALFEELAVLSTRARAAAMQRDVAATTRHVTALAAVRKKLRPYFESMQTKEALAKMDQDHERNMQALSARARGDDRALLELLRKSVADSEQEVSGEGNPTAFVVQEEIGDTLMRMKQPKEAATAYAAALAKHPRRARALLGAARAAKAAGDAAGARTAYQQLLDVWKSAEPGIEGLDEARAAVATDK